MMNKFFILLLSACCLLTTACDKENDETAQGFRIMKADVDLVAGGGTVIRLYRLRQIQRKFRQIPMLR